MAPKVVSLVLNWNNVDDTRQVLLDLKAQDYPNLEIVLIDNNSKRNVKESLEDILGITRINNADNLGYAAGNNVGFEYALNNNADLILIVNNDLAIPDKSAVSKLIDALSQEDDDVAAFGVTLLDYYTKQIQENGTFFFSGQQHPNGINAFRQKLADSDRYVDGAPGAFFIIKKEVLEKITFFDEHLFMYADETDLFFRVWKAGYKVKMAPDIQVLHKGDHSAQLESNRVTYYKTRNSLYFLKKHKTCLDGGSSVLCAQLVEAAKRGIRLAVLESNFSKTLAIVRAIKDFAFMKMGKSDNY